MLLLGWKALVSPAHLYFSFLSAPQSTSTTGATRPVWATPRTARFPRAQTETAGPPEPPPLHSIPRRLGIKVTCLSGIWASFPPFLSPPTPEAHKLFCPFLCFWCRNQKRSYIWSGGVCEEFTETTAEPDVGSLCGSPHSRWCLCKSGFHDAARRLSSPAQLCLHGDLKISL